MSASQQVTDICSSATSVPSGTYLPLGDFSDLIGCPINGEWCIRFYDNWEMDDGFIWTADLNFSSSILPQDTWGYENTYDTGGNSTSGAWSGPDMNDAIGFIGTANPVVSGNINYTFTATDDFGCSYDTSINVTVLPINDPTCCIMPNVNAGSDNNTCILSYTLDASELTSGNSGIWTYTSAVGSAVFTDENNPNTEVSVTMPGIYEFTWTEYYLGNTANTACLDSDVVAITFNETFDPTITEINDMCVSATPFQIFTVDYGDLTCTPSTTALDATTGIFNPSSAGPGTYVIRNTINGPCTGPGFDEESFTIYDEIEIINFSEVCGPTGSPTLFTVSWDVVGSEGTPFSEYLINGIPQAGTSFTEDIVSPGSYNYVVTDAEGCSEYTIEGFRDCGCPLFAGTMGSLQTIVLCQNECTVPNVTHNGDQETDGGAGIFEFMIHNGNNIPLAYSNTPNFCMSDISGASFNTIYYVSAICGLPSGGHANISTGCYSISQGTPVMWQQNPIASAGTNKDTCGLVIKLDANTPETGMYGYWTSSCDFFTIGGTSHTDPDAIVMANNYNTCTFTWNVANGECVATDDVTISFLSTPNPYAGEDIVICGNEAIMAAVPSLPSTTLSWSGNGTTFNPQSSANATAQVSNFGTYLYTAIEDNGACSGTDDVLVTYIQGPSPTTTPNVDSVCGVEYNLIVYNVAGTGQWTAYEDGIPVIPAPLYTPSITSEEVTVTIGNYTGLSREIEFIWEETNQVQGVECTGSASKTVVFAKSPIASVGAIDESEICGNFNEFNADTTGSGWAIGGWIAKEVIGTWDDASIPEATFWINPDGAYGDTAHIRTPFLWTMRNPEYLGCVSADTAWVTFYEKPEANAGLDDATCGKDYILGAVYDITGNLSYNPNGWWETHTSPEDAIATIANSNLDTTNVTVTHNGIYQFIFRENNAFLPMCFDTDTVQIEFVETPIITAGEDKDVCGPCLNLDGISGGFDGTWLPNGASFENYNDPNTQACVNTFVDYDFIWVESNSAITQTFSCSAKDTAIITFWPIPEPDILTDTADSTACGLTYTNLRAELPGSGITGYWYTEDPGAIIEPNVFDVFPSVTVSSYGYHTFYWIEESAQS